MIVACSRCQLQYDVRAYPEGTQVQCRCGQVLTVPAHVIAVVRCPSCGGTVDAQAQRCQFCQNMISRKACHQCAAAVREEARFCDQCGAQLRAFSTDIAKATAHDCPRYRVPMFAQTCAGYPVEVCAECLGIWVSHEVLEHIYRDAPKRIEPVTEKTSAESSTGLQPGAVVAYIPCLVCGKHMNRINYARRSGIIIDVCKEHGVWFDADELNLILEYNASGAAAQAATRTAVERELEKAKLHTQLVALHRENQQQQLFVRALNVRFIL